MLQPSSGPLAGYFARAVTSPTARTLPATAIWLGLCAALLFVVTRPDVLNVTHDAIERVVALLR